MLADGASKRRRPRAQGRADACTCTAGRREGARVVFAAAGDASAKALRKALVAGAGASSRAAARKHLAVAVPALPSRRRRAWPRRWPAPWAMRLYVYRHTKPSAPPAPKLQRVTLVCGKADAGGRARRPAARRGHRRRRGAGARMRQPPRQPLHADLPGRRRRSKPGQGARPEGRGARPQGHREARHGLASWRWRRARTSRCVHRAAATTARPRRQAPVVLVGKGITFDTGGISHQAGGRDGRDEVRHGRRRQRAGHAARGGANSSRRSTWSA